MGSEPFSQSKSQLYSISGYVDLLSLYEEKEDRFIFWLSIPR